MSALGQKQTLDWRLPGGTWMCRSGHRQVAVTFAEAVIRSVVLNVEYLSAVGWRRGHLWEEAMSPQRTLVAVVIAACVADCAGQRAQIANYAQNKMIGLTKEQVLACMGTPASKATEGATEVWSYPSESRFCTVNRRATAELLRKP